MSSAEETQRRGRPKGDGNGAAPPRLEEQHAELARLHRALAAQRRELEQVRRELLRREGYVDALQAQLDVRSLCDNDLQDVARNLEAQLVERDDELASAWQENEWRRRTETALRQEIEWRCATEDALRHELSDLERKLAAHEATRLWRWGRRYWALKRFVREALRRGPS